MDPSCDHGISVHEDQAFFREAVLFTAGQTGLNATLIEKLKVPGNPPIDLSPARKEKLKTQINTELKPVLRPVDFESFDLDGAFDIVARTSCQL